MTVLYQSILDALNRRLAQLGIPPLAPTEGKPLRYEEVQALLETVFPGGFDVVLKPTGPLDERSIRRMTAIARAPKNTKLRRDLLAQYGSKGGLARAKSLQPQERSAIATKGGHAYAKKVPAHLRSALARGAAKKRWEKQKASL